ncbi:MAG: hypothetical protein AAF841_04020 [Pseudomonadota bacterium]
MEYVVTVQVCIVIILIASIIVSDVVLYLTPDAKGTLPGDLTGDTYSEVTRYLGKLAPIAPWLWGMIAGRVFHWGQEPVFSDPAWLNMVVLLGVSALILIPFSIWRRSIWQPISSVFGMMLVFFIAYVLGGFFWPENVGTIAFR